MSAPFVTEPFLLFKLIFKKIWNNLHVWLSLKYFEILKNYDFIYLFIYLFVSLNFDIEFLVDLDNYYIIINADFKIIIIINPPIFSHFQRELVILKCLKLKHNKVP